MANLFSRMLRDEDGVSVVEFAAIAPVLCMTLLGIYDFSFNMYAESIIEGAVQKASRDATIEQYAQNPAALDEKVRDAVQNLVYDADVTFTRTGYANYADMYRAEEYTDENGDGMCNNNEPFVDANGNGDWDSDAALDTSEGARDAVLYEVTATYDRAFPLAGLLGFEQEVSVVARTVLRNQPFTASEERGQVRNCV